MISSLIEFIYKQKKKFELYKDEKKILKKNKKYIKLLKNEKSKSELNNNRILKIMKNVYPNWDNCDNNLFVSDYFFQTKMLKKLNNINYRGNGVIDGSSYFTDKNYLEKVLGVMNPPLTVARCIDGNYYNKDYNIISKDEFLSILNQYNSLVFKVSIGSSHGRGVRNIEKQHYIKSIDNFGKNYIVQQKIEQCDFFAGFNPSSVNVIRITSLLLDDEVIILSSILRVGAPGSFCDLLANNRTNPRIIAINEDGSLENKAIDPYEGKVFDNIFGKEIKGVIPKFNNIIELVKKEHINYKHHRIIGWDITIDKKLNIICIEFNSTVPGIIQSQMCCGPIFAKKIKNKTILELLLNDVKISD